MGEGGISSKKANIKIREIHPSQYGKICPVETTEGKNAGLILSFANESKVNNKGFIETPFAMWNFIEKKINNNKLNKHLNKLIN